MSVPPLIWFLMACGGLWTLGHIWAELRDIRDELRSLNLTDIGASLDGIRGGLARMNANTEARMPDLTRRPGESEGDYFRRLAEAERRRG